MYYEAHIMQHFLPFCMRHQLAHLTIQSEYKTVSEYTWLRQELLLFSSLTRKNKKIFEDVV